MKTRCRVISGHRILKEAFDVHEGGHVCFYCNGKPCNHGTNPERVCGEEVLAKFDKNALSALFELLCSETFEGVSPKELQITDEDILNNLQVHDQEPGAEEGVSLEWKTSDGRWISWPWNW